MNDNLLLISGKTASGKSASFMNMRNPGGVLYANCENNKKLPFKSGFHELTIVDPLQVFEIFDHAKNNKDKYHTIIIDSSTYLMDMFESVYVNGAADGRAAWGNYANFWKELMQKYVAEAEVNVVMTGHTLDVMNETDMVRETLVKVKGSLMNNGIESYFSTVVSTKRMPLTKLEMYKSDLLTITEEDEIQGFKYCYQTKLTKDTVNERIRAPLGMWDQQETYINNDLQLVLDRFGKYYS